MAKWGSLFLVSTIQKQRVPKILNPITGLAFYSDRFEKQYTKGSNNFGSRVLISGTAKHLVFKICHSPYSYFSVSASCIYGQAILFLTSNQSHPSICSIFVDLYRPSEFLLSSSLLALQSGPLPAKAPSCLQCVDIVKDQGTAPFSTPSIFKKKFIAN